MQNLPLEERYVQVRRVIASIAYQNENIDEQERLILASSMAGHYQPSDDQVHILVEDAIKRPRIEDIVCHICDQQFIRLLLTDLMTLAILKGEWEESEYTAAVRAVDALNLPRDLVFNIKQAFDLLVAIARDLAVN